MRKQFAYLLTEQAKKNKDIWLLTGDLGYGNLDIFRDTFPDRFLNCGAAEQVMSDIAVGLALSGKIPFVYSITTFLLYRPFETWRTYVNHELIPVKLVGAGRDKDYSHDGISHWSNDALDVLNTLPNINRYWPQKEADLEGMVKAMVESNEPDFISLRR